MSYYREGEEIFNINLNTIRNKSESERKQFAYNCSGYIFSRYLDRGYSERESYEQVFKIWAMVCANDAHISTGEFELFNAAFGGGCTFGEFRSIVSKFQSQQYRNEMEYEFRNSRDAEFCEAFICVMILACYADYDVDPAEKNLIVSFCQIYSDKFE